MGRKGVISVLVLIAGVLLSEHGAKGQTSSTTPGSELKDMTSTQLAEYAKKTGALYSSDTALPVIRIMASKGAAFFVTVLFGIEVPKCDHNTKYALLKILLELILSDNDPVCRVSLTIFNNDNLGTLFEAANSTVLEMMKPTDCSQFQPVSRGLNKNVSMYSNDTIISIFNFRKDFLTKEALKSGSACTYGLDSTEWLTTNIGSSIGNFPFSEMMILSPNFKPYGTLNLLTMDQIIDVIIYSKLCTSEFPENAEEYSRAVSQKLNMEGYDYARSFMLELKVHMIDSQNGPITSPKVDGRIASPVVGDYFCRTLLGLLKIQFSRFSATDWKIWFIDVLPMCISSITAEQLSVLTIDVVGDCRNVQIIAEGFNIAFPYMDKVSQSNFANWMIGIIENNPSKCKGYAVTALFYRFVICVDITVIRELDPYFSLADTMMYLSASQIGQALVTEPGGLSNATLCQLVMEHISNSVDPVEKYGAFWDSLNAAYKDTEFTNEAKMVMLDATVQMMSDTLSTAGAPTWNDWFDVKIKVVLTAMNRNILDKLPVIKDCDSYKALARPLSNCYEGAENKQDVFDFRNKYMKNNKKCMDAETSTVDYVNNYYGNYSAMATYEQMITYYPAFNCFEYGVLALLTGPQIGDMMVLSKAYESKDKITIVFVHLQTRPIYIVDACMFQFTVTAQQKGIIIGKLVGETMLNYYMAIKSEDLKTYNETQMANFMEYYIIILVPFFTQETLKLFPVTKCDIVVVIVTGLDKGISSMSVDTRTLIGNWAADCFMSPTLNGCRGVFQTSSDLVVVFKGFFVYISLAKVNLIYPPFDMPLVIANASVDQKADYFCSPEVMTSVEKSMLVLNSLRGVDFTIEIEVIFTFLAQVNINIAQQNVQMMTLGVKQACMKILFTDLLSNMNSMTTQEVMTIQTAFQFILVGITVEVVDIMPTTMSCEMYHGIFSAFGSVANQLPQDVVMALYRKMLDCLQAKYDGASAVCSSLYSDSASFISNIFFEFIPYVEVYVPNMYYPAFNWYDVLDKMTVRQLGDMFVNSSAIHDTLKAALIVAEVQKRDNTEIYRFMSACSNKAKELNITTFDPTIGPLVTEAVYGAVIVQLTKVEVYITVFSGLLQLIMPYISPEDMENVPVIDCKCQKEVVDGFSERFNILSDGQKQAMYRQIKSFNMKQKNTKGSPCGTVSGSSGEWLDMTFKRFIVFAVFPDFRALNPGFKAADCLTDLTGEQVAWYAIESGAMMDAQQMTSICESMKTREKMDVFLGELLVRAPDRVQWSISGGVLLIYAFKLNQEHFITFTRTDWIDFMQSMKNCLYAIKEAQLLLIPSPLPCDSYQPIVEPLGASYPYMTEDTRELVYNIYMKRQLDNTPAQNGVRCGQQTDKTQEWLDKNLGPFYIYALISDIEKWNVVFQLTLVISTLSPEQMGEVAVAKIDYKGTACQVAEQVKTFSVDQASTFSYSFSAGLKDIKIRNTEICYEYLSAIIMAMKPAFASYSSKDWEALFSVIKPLSLCMDADQMTIILASADCRAYTQAVKYLSVNYHDYIPRTQASLSVILYGFLKQQPPSPSGPCPVRRESDADKIMRLFGNFVLLIRYDVILEILHISDMSGLLHYLSPEQIAEYALTGDVLSNINKSNNLISRLEPMEFEELNNFLTSFSNLAKEKNMVSLPNPVIRSELCNVIYTTCARQFSVFTDSQFEMFWGHQFQLCLPSITPSQIQQIPETMSCPAFKSVIAACSKEYNKLLYSAQTAMYQKAESYLISKSTASGPPCPASSGGDGVWIEECFGAFSELAEYSIFTKLNPGLMCYRAPAHFTDEQLGSCAADPKILADQGSMAQILDVISNENIRSFMITFNARCEKDHITINKEMKMYIVVEVMYKIGFGITSYRPDDYADLFGIQLRLFHSEINAKIYSFIPTDISCECLANIIKSISEVGNTANMEDTCRFIGSVLEKQIQSTGVACTRGGMDSRAWVQKYYGIYIATASYSDIERFYPDFNPEDCKDLLTLNQLAIACASITDSASIISIVNSVARDQTKLPAFLDTLKSQLLLKSATLSKKVSESILMTIGPSVFSKFINFDREMTGTWMKTMSFLFSGLNATIMDLLPYGMSCENYQIVMACVNEMRPGLSTAQRKAVVQYQKSYLSYQTATNGDACTTQITNYGFYILKYFGSFYCDWTNEDLMAINPKMSSVSHELFCSAGQ